MNFRYGTGDELIFDMVVNHNEYRLPHKFEENDIIIDIGAHIGSFTYASYIRGSRLIYSIEANYDNFLLANKNLEPYIDKGHVFLTYGAMWRSDRNKDVLRVSSFENFEGKHLKNLINTGSSQVIWNEEGIEVPKINFDRFITKVLRDTGQNRIRWICKIVAAF